jgi:uncharacterized membrane protein YdbT with pleckstrin-like domain
MENREQNRGPDERILLRTKRHWAIFIGPVLFMIFAGLSIPSRGMPALVLLAVGIAWALLSSISFQTSEFAITKERLLIRTGLPWGRVRDIPLSNIEVVDFYQPALGKILDFGKIIVRSKAGKKQYFTMVRAPLQFTHAAHEYIQAVRDRKD